MRCCAASVRSLTVEVAAYSSQPRHSPRLERCAQRVGSERAAVVAWPALAQRGHGDRGAGWAAAEKQDAVSVARETPTELPAKQPRATLVQAVGAEP